MDECDIRSDLLILLHPSPPRSNKNATAEQHKINPIAAGGVMLEDASKDDNRTC